MTNDQAELGPSLGDPSLVPVFRGADLGYTDTGVTRLVESGVMCPTMMREVEGGGVIFSVLAHLLTTSEHEDLLNKTCINDHELIFGNCFRMVKQR